MLQSLLSNPDNDYKHCMLFLFIYFSTTKFGSWFYSC